MWGASKSDGEAATWQSHQQPSHHRPTPPRYVVLDFETTGFDCANHEIIEIGAIKFERGAELCASFHALIVPNKRIPAKITELTGLDYSMLVRDGYYIEQAWPVFLKFCENLPLVAFNAPFDQRFFDATCSRLSLGQPMREWRCALQVARAAWPGLASYKLSALARLGGLALEDEHRALGDCRRAISIFESATRSLVPNHP